MWYVRCVDVWTRFLCFLGEMQMACFVIYKARPTTRQLTRIETRTCVAGQDTSCVGVYSILEGGFWPPYDAVTNNTAFRHPEGCGSDGTTVVTPPSVPL